MTAKYTDEIDDCNSICPYCGDSFQVEAEDYSEDEREIECVCGKKYYLTTCYTVFHETKPNCALNNEKHLWLEMRDPKFSCCSKCGLVRFSDEINDNEGL